MFLSKNKQHVPGDITEVAPGWKYDPSHTTEWYDGIRARYAAGADDINASHLTETRRSTNRDEWIDLTAARKRAKEGPAVERIVARMDHAGSYNEKLDAISAALKFLLEHR